VDSLLYPVIPRSETVGSVGYLRILTLVGVLEHPVTVTGLASGYVNSLLLKMTEIVNFPMKNGDFPQLS